MKTRLLTFVLLLILGLPLMAQEMSATFSPSTIYVNNFNTASFDPTDPGSQPLLTTLTIRNNSAESFVFLLKIAVKWNDIELTNATYRSKEPIAANSNFFPLTNRDLITTSSSTYFNEEGVGGISLNSVIENNEVLKSAVLAGFFPDGTVKLEVSVKKLGAATYSNPAVFSIVVRNAGTISLVSPGVPIGQIPPEISVNPVNFFWNAIMTEFNQFNLIIREFPPASPPTAGSVETMGSLFYPQMPSPVMGTSFNDFLPFVPGNYYAWKVSTGLYTESNPFTRNRANNSLDSNWFVFRYVTAEESPANQINELLAVLSSLGNPDMNTLFSQGYAPIGIVQIDGRSYSGEEAVNLIRNLIGQNIAVQIGN